VSDIKIFIPSLGSTKFTKSLTISLGVKKLPPDFFVSSANCSRRYSKASPKISVLFKSEFLSLGELK
jgi:hypothetical protein